MKITVTFPKTETTVTIEASEETAQRYADLLEKNISMIIVAIENGMAAGAPHFSRSGESRPS